MKIFLVTSGEYSDYRVDAVYFDRSQAERYIEVIGGDQIEEMKEGPVVHPWNIYNVDIHGNGYTNVSFVSSTADALKAASESPDKTDLLKPMEVRYDGNIGTTVYYHFKAYRVKARNKEHAAKIASEQRAKAIASERINWSWISSDEDFKRYQWVEDHGKVVEGEPPAWVTQGERPEAVAEAFKRSVARQIGQMTPMTIEQAGAEIRFRSKASVATTGTPTEGGV